LVLKWFPIGWATVTWSFSRREHWLRVYKDKYICIWRSDKELYKLNNEMLHTSYYNSNNVSSIISDRTRREVSAGVIKWRVH
jgi:hypothetical protein